MDETTSKHRLTDFLVKELNDTSCYQRVYDMVESVLNQKKKENNIYEFIIGIVMLIMG